MGGPLPIGDCMAVYLGIVKCWCVYTCPPVYRESKHLSIMEDSDRYSTFSFHGFRHTTPSENNVAKNRVNLQQHYLK